MIDVSELMDDPDFLSPYPIQLVRRANVANEHGEGVMTESATSIEGIIQPGSGDMMEKLPESARLQESIRIWTRATLTPQQEGVDGYGDLLVYRGKRWLVRVVDDFSTWGNGYTKAVAIFESLSK